MNPFHGFLHELPIVVGKGLAIFVSFVKVRLEHFYHFNRLKYLLYLCLEGEVTHRPIARISLQRGNMVTGTMTVIFFILLHFRVVK